jgi:hypothetical protein
MSRIDPRFNAHKTKNENDELQEVECGCKAMSGRRRRKPERRQGNHRLLGRFANFSVRIKRDIQTVSFNSAVKYVSSSKS